MVNYFNERLKKIKLEKEEFKKLEKELEELQQENSKLKYKITIQKELITKTENNLIRLTKNPFVSLYHNIMGNKDEKLEETKDEYDTACEKYEEFKKTIEVQEIEIKQKQEEIKKYKNLSEEYTEVLKEKEKYLIANNDKNAPALLQLTEEKLKINNHINETNEAIKAGNQVLSGLNEIISQLKSAEGWGAFDMLGGGLIANAVKHSKLDEAKSRITSTGKLIEKFTNELKDIQFNDNIENSIDIGDFLTFADFFFDGLLVDMFVQSKIEKALSNINSTKSKVQDIIIKLKLNIKQFENELKNIELKRIKIIDP